ncbi:MAG TPA: hypothetical protein VGB44_08085 [Flavobacterium sp.]
MKKVRVHILILFFFSLALSAQEKKVVTEIDTTRNKIGAQFNFTLKTAVDSMSIVMFPSGQQFGPLEVIRTYPVDTIRKGRIFHLIQKYGLTQFDSGRYTIPRLKVQIDKAQFLTDSITVEVVPVKVDTLKQKMYDIKDVVKAEKASNWWIYLLIAIALAAAAFFGYKFWKKHQKIKVTTPTYKTPIEKATVLLQQLEKKGLLQRGEVKNYYSELTDIARNYIEEAIKIPAMESTTSELIVALRTAAAKKNMSLSPETVASLENVLKHADLVKFAKSQPAEYEIAGDREKIERTIMTLDQSIPAESEDFEAVNDVRRQLMLKKAKRRKISLIAASLGAVFFCFAVYHYVTRGMEMFDLIKGSTPKAMLEGEWVKSEYGNPAVHIETPKVLMRQDPEKVLPKEAFAITKEFQMFTYGAMNLPLFVQVSTNKLREPGDIDLNMVVEGSLRELEMRGGKSIIVKQEEFDTGQGITGVKAYGTMQISEPITNISKKIRYEMLLFKQDQGLQQVIVSYYDGDKDSEEIMRRIINSVELQQATP